MNSPISPAWRSKIMAERKRKNGTPLPMETSKALAKLCGILEYKKRLKVELEKLKHEVLHINPTVHATRLEMVDKFLDMLPIIEPDNPKISNAYEGQFLTNEIRDANREIILYLGYVYQDGAGIQAGWYDTYGQLKYPGIHWTDFHYNMKVLEPVASCLKKDIVVEELEAQFEDSLVMEKNYKFLNVHDLWIDVVSDIRKLLKLRTKKEMDAKAEERKKPVIIYEE